MSRLPQMSVVIPTQGRRASLLQVLRALSVQTLPADCFEIVGAFDGEPGATRHELAGAAAGCQLRTVSGPAGGPGAARNRGAAEARGEVLVFLDDDIVPAPTCLAEHLAAHAPGEAWVGLGRVDLPPRVTRTAWERYLTARYDEHFAKLARPGYAPTFWDCLSGSLSLPRALFEQAGGFEAGLARHEDVELGYRLAGLEARFVYRPEAAGLHLYRRGLEGGLGDALGEGRTAGVLVRRHRALRPRMLGARWQRYAPAVRAALRQVLAEPGRHARALRVARAWLARVDASLLPFALRRPVYQWAYHLHFWQGLRETAPELLP